MYPHQTERLTAALETAGADALVAASAANVAYVTGFRSLFRTVYPASESYAIVTRGGTALIVPTIDAPAVVESDADPTHVVCHGRFHLALDDAGAGAQRLRELTKTPATSAADALASALDALGVRGKGRIGLDDAGLPAGRRTQLAERLGAFTLVPASDAFVTARWIKGPYEIDCLRQALWVAEEAINAVLDLLQPGVTEREVATAFEHEVTQRGAVPNATIIVFGPGSAIPAPWPTDRALRTGDLVRFDLGCAVKGYHGDVARMAVMGEPTARQQTQFDAISAGVQGALDAMRPGVTGASVFETAVTATRKAGLAGFDRHHVGHGIGLEASELPMLAPGGGALEAGMIVRVEAPYYVVGETGLNVKETVLVTRAGVHTLNRSNRGLIVLD
jgi:Xaa-Pro aminopeptidase